jgi:alpha-mannosidase
MQSPVPFWMLRALRLPIVHGAGKRLLGRARKKHADLIPPEAEAGAEAFFVQDLMGHLDLNEDGKPDAFRFAVTNCWFNQSLRGVELAMDGKTIKPSRIQVDNGSTTLTADQISRMRFLPGEPLIFTIDKLRLRNGLHFLSLNLDCDLVPMLQPLIPLVVDKNGVRVAIIDEPWDPELVPNTEAFSGKTVHYCPHVHYDYEWLRTAPEFAKVAAGNLQEAVRILERHPEYTFVVDQVPQLQALQSRDPDAFSKLAQFIRDGRVEPALGGYIEPDTNIPSGESLVRQFSTWQAYCKTKFGRFSKSAWLIDSFGMSAQLPQILRKCGATGLFFSRKLPRSAEVDSDFLWQGLDGATIPTHHMAQFYFAGYPLDTDPKRAVYRISRAATRLAENSDRDDLFCPAGIDHGMPQMHAPDTIRDWNRRFPDTPVRFSTPERYLETLDPEALDTYAGELNPELSGVGSARIDLKQSARRAENTLLAAEALAAIPLAGSPGSPDPVIDAAWRDLMLSQFHDSVTGCNTDEVAQDVRRRLWRAIDRGKTVIDRRINSLFDHVARAELPGAPILVFNPTGFARTELVEIDLTSGKDGFPSITDGSRYVPYQVLSVERFGDGDAKFARVCFPASAPPLGYRLYYLTENEKFEKPTVFQPVRVGKDFLENGKIFVRFHKRKGHIRFVADKLTERLWQIPHTGELVLRRDRGTLYQEFFHGCKMKPRKTEIKVVENGPLRASIEVTGFVGKSRFTTRYTLGVGKRRLDIETKIDFKDPGKALFCRIPDLYGMQRTLVEVPFGAIERKVDKNISQIAQNFVHVDLEKKKSLTILNRGLPAYQQLEREIRMTLHRSVDKIHFWDAGTGALGIGRHRFEYALRFSNAWYEEARPWKHGLTYNSPLIVVGPREPGRVCCDHGAKKAESYARLSNNDVAITSFAPAANGKIRLRCYEASGQQSDTMLKFGFPVRSAILTDMLGRKAADLSIGKRGIQLTFRPFEIKTILVEPIDPNPVVTKEGAES